MPQTRERTIELTDPRALRAVAHPMRLELLGLLRRTGPLTATQCADRTGESPASCSFHLRQLAKYGLVEEAGGGRGRARPWRATATSTLWPAPGAGPELDAAAAMLSRVVLERYFGQALEWLERRGEEPREWADLLDIGDVVLYLTAAELTELEARIGELLEPYQRRLEEPGSRPPGSRAINLIRFLLPLPGEPLPGEPQGEPVPGESVPGEPRGE